MVTKTYIATTKLTVPIVQNGKVQYYVNFHDEKNTYTTANEQEQKALESLPLFNRHFRIFRTVGTENKQKQTTTQPPQVDPPQKNTSPNDFEVMEQITDWQSAKEILKGEPYNVPYQALNTPEAILKKAEEVRIRFSNLQIFN